MSGSRIVTSRSMQKRGFTNVDYALQAYGSMYLANGTATTLETADTPVGLRLFTTGVLSGWTYVAGTTGAVTAYATYAAGAATQVTDATHGLATGDIITIRGTTNYNGVYTVTVLTADTFTIPEAYVADDGASDWDKPSYMLAGASAAGKYNLQYDISMVEATGGSLIVYLPYVGTTAQTACTGTVTGATTVQTVSGNGIVTIAAADRVFMTAESAGTNTVTNSVGQISLVRV